MEVKRQFIQDRWDAWYLVLWQLLLLLLHQLRDSSQQAAMQISRGVVYVHVRPCCHHDRVRDAGQYWGGA